MHLKEIRHQFLYRQNFINIFFNPISDKLMMPRFQYQFQLSFHYDLINLYDNCTKYYFFSVNH